MRQQRGRGVGRGDPGLLTRAVEKVFRLVRLAEFEILFVLFFLIAFVLFKDLMSRPEYNSIFVKKPDLDGRWPGLIIICLMLLAWFLGMGLDSSCLQAYRWNFVKCHAEVTANSPCLHHVAVQFYG
ncbi:Os08g0528601 [Oryza sativa Japonica Group]|uniref:Os08g0528601 protein n=1 Tax=Oryza sativa subsp. japonica TaxID=39947 RepID=Q6ZIB8_ORYSJ|nr:hypothetical protein [Oryza sativa Japonica Group]BAH94390.1 Os08g0528601 [Oryza sativa Japonica Group]|eukprot:NP_001175662.1 Os08g0528601 [Oryza sativa Japonica Group]